MAEPKVGVNTGNRGKGRPKGSPNKVGGHLRDAIIAAAEAAGGKGGTVAYLTEQAIQNPMGFMTLLGKVLPLQVAGDPNNPVNVVTRIEIVAADGNRTD